ncbi:Transglutaminase-like enzyme, putative cysteine protease [Chelatococcus sambhunathii]|uniref:Transglutaminase n=2 Tax=Chelatococcus TaxID=28209 RepID=A0AAC9JTS5_9HYPH|nr:MULTISPECIES: transglutaminase family protein [Chelatococcus]APF38501.1 transglutaminase [Chelatococcus daeguensis]CUA89949.1 Transglutaminase-like enzyme, putative cysteine protease [Chelatococcus sambhunathii]
MRIRVSHTTRYDYSPPAKSAIQLLRLTPRGHEGQHVRHWRIDVDAPCRLKAGEDALGNITHAFTLEGPIQSFSVTVDGEVETQDSAGVVRGTVERFPPGLFLRTTTLTEPDDAILALAGEVREAMRRDPIVGLHDLSGMIHARMAFDTEATTTATKAGAALALGHGVCQDFAHIFISAARVLGVSARYVSGYLLRHDGLVVQEAGHAWAEAHVGGLGWVGFDPAHGLSPTDAYVRLAAALDYHGAAPILGSRYGGGQESLDVSVRVEHARRQIQS